MCGGLVCRLTQLPPQGVASHAGTSLTIGFTCDFFTCSSRVFRVIGMRLHEARVSGERRIRCVGCLFVHVQGDLVVSSLHGRTVNGTAFLPTCYFFVSPSSGVSCGTSCPALTGRVGAAHRAACHRLGRRRVTRRGWRSNPRFALTSSCMHVCLEPARNRSYLHWSFQHESDTRTSVSVTVHVLPGDYGFILMFPSHAHWHDLPSYGQWKNSVLCFTGICKTDATLSGLHRYA